MEIVITDKALKWLREEVRVKNGDTVKFFARYGGYSPVQEGFSIGFTIAKPYNIAVRNEYDGILFFIEDADLWFFDGHNLYVKYNENLNEIEYEYKK